MKKNKKLKNQKTNVNFILVCLISLILISAIGGFSFGVKYYYKKEKLNQEECNHNKIILIEDNGNIKVKCKKCGINIKGE